MNAVLAILREEGVLEILQVLPSNYSLLQYCRRVLSKYFSSSSHPEVSVAVTSANFQPCFSNLNSQQPEKWGMELEKHVNVNCQKVNLIFEIKIAMK